MRGRIDRPPQPLIGLEIAEDGRRSLVRRVVGDLLEDNGCFVGELDPGLGGPQREIALLREWVHRDCLGVETEHALFRGVLDEERQHLLEQAMAAEARVDHALAQVSDGRAGPLHLPRETAYDLARGSHSHAYLEEPAVQHLAHVIREIEVVVGHGVAVNGIGTLGDGDGVVGGHQAKSDWRGPGVDGGRRHGARLHDGVAACRITAVRSFAARPRRVHRWGRRSGARGDRRGVPAGAARVADRSGPGPT